MTYVVSISPVKEPYLYPLGTALNSGLILFRGLWGGLAGRSLDPAWPRLGHLPMLFGGCWKGRYIPRFPLKGSFKGDMGPGIVYMV